MRDAGNAVALPAAPFDVVQFASLGPDADAALAQRFRVLQWTDRTAPCADALVGIRVAVTSVRRGFTQEMLGALPALQAVCSWGVGFETLDLEAMQRRGVVMSNTPDVLDDCVADLA